MKGGPLRALIQPMEHAEEEWKEIMPKVRQERTKYRLEELEKELDYEKAMGRWDNPTTRKLREEIKRVRAQKLLEAEAAKLPPEPKEEYRGATSLMDFLAESKIPIRRGALEAYQEYDPLRLPEPEAQSHPALYVARRIVSPKDMKAMEMLWMMAKENDSLEEYKQELLSQLAKGARAMQDRLRPDAKPLW